MNFNYHRENNDVISSTNLTLKSQDKSALRKKSKETGDILMYCQNLTCVLLIMSLTNAEENFSFSFFFLFLILMIWPGHLNFCYLNHLSDFSIVN